jgi:hypothetical protein
MEELQIQEEELGFRDFRNKLIERLTMTKINEENGMDSTEEDLVVLKAVHDHLWYNGAVIFLESRFSGSEGMAEQGFLFCQ